MSRGLYIASTVARSGKSTVMLGMMEFLSSLGWRVGFFRPVISNGGEQDMAIQLIAGRYKLDFPYDAMYGCTLDTARELISQDRDDELISLILGKYKTLEKNCDFIVTVGTDYVGINAPLEFEFNIDIANNLGIPLVPVVNGDGRTAKEIVDAVMMLIEALEQKKCDVLAVFINRVAPREKNTVDLGLRQALQTTIPFNVLPKLSVLEKPTIGEIARDLGAEVLHGTQEGLDREIDNYKVAAMELPHFLDRIEEGSLIITPGDRSDIILGALMAHESQTFPKISGLLLTGGMKPAPQIEKLIGGLSKILIPVLGVQTDTFTTAMTVNTIQGAIVPSSRRKIAGALGIFEEFVNMQELQRHIAITRTQRVTPLMFEYELISRAKTRCRHIVLAEGTEDRILRAAEILLLRGFCELTLLGDPAEIGRRVESIGISLQGVNIVDPLTSALRNQYADTYYELRKHKGISRELAYDIMADVSYFGTAMVYHGNADGMVSGAVHTTQHTIRPAFEIIKTKPGCSIVSSVFFMCLADRVLVFGDCAVNPNPTAEQLADIAISSADTARAFGIEPLVAMLSYSSGESGKGEDVDKVREATAIARRLRPDLRVEGPIQYDAAVDPDVAKSKMPGSDVAGHATVFIFPDLNTGNNTYKAVQRSANAVAIGPVLQGLNKPVNDLSRGCTVTDIVNTVAITAIQAQMDESL